MCSGSACPRTAKPSIPLVWEYDPRYYGGGVDLKLMAWCDAAGRLWMTAGFRKPTGNSAGYQSSLPNRRLPRFNPRQFALFQMQSGPRHVSERTGVVRWWITVCLAACFPSRLRVDAQAFSPEGNPLAISAKVSRRRRTSSLPSIFRVHFRIGWTGPGQGRGFIVPLNVKSSSLTATVSCRN